MVEVVGPAGEPTGFLDGALASDHTRPLGVKARGYAEYLLVSGCRVQKGLAQIYLLTPRRVL